MFSCLRRVDRSPLLWIWIECFFDHSFFLMNFAILNSVYKKEKENNDHSQWRREECQRWQKTVFSKVEEKCGGLSRKLTHSLPCHTPLPSAGCSLGFGFIQKGPARSFPSWFGCCCSACPKMAGTPSVSRAPFLPPVCRRVVVSQLQQCVSSLHVQLRLSPLANRLGKPASLSPWGFTSFLVYPSPKRYSKDWDCL